MTQDAIPRTDQIADLASASEAHPTGDPSGGGDSEGRDSEGTVEPRQCGRCRVMYEGDPTLHYRARGQWSLCPACDAILMPRKRRGNVIDLHRPTQASDEG